MHVKTCDEGKDTVINTKYVIQGSLQSKNSKFFHASKPNIQLSHKPDQPGCTTLTQTHYCYQEPD